MRCPKIDSGSTTGYGRRFWTSTTLDVVLFSGWCTSLRFLMIVVPSVTAPDLFAFVVSVNVFTTYSIADHRQWIVQTLMGCPHSVSTICPHLRFWTHSVYMRHRRFRSKSHNKRTVVSFWLPCPFLVDVTSFVKLPTPAA